MNVQTSEWHERIVHWIDTLKKDFYLPLQELHWEAAFTMDQLSLSQANALFYQAVEPGFTWGHTWEYGWFRTSITLPAEAEGKRIVLDLQPGMESTVFVNGQPFGTWRAEWVDEPHHYIEDNFITACAKAGDRYDICMEVYAGHYYPTWGMTDGHNVTGPVMEGDYEDPLTEGARVTLGHGSFGIWNEDAYQLFMDVSTLQSLLEALDPSTLRAAKVAEALEQFTLTVDFEQSLAGRISDYRTAREQLKPALSAVNGSTMPQFYAIGNAHIDLAWLWPFAETYRKTARTFAAQLRLLEEYPEYTFIQSTPASYEMCRKYYPELFEKVRASIREGRWLADGAMWVEPDTNMTSGESLIRQLLYGKRYYKEVLGVNPEVLWLPDTFGYSGALPQILNHFGVKYLVTQKVFWSYNSSEAFPYHYFAWEGLDGSKITTFLPTSYLYRTSPASSNKIWKNRSQMRDLEGFLYPFGYGDGGGGPCRDHIEYAKRYRNLEGSVRMEMTSPLRFFQDMDALGGPKNTYVGELYFTAHRGTYTSQAMIKKHNRTAEFRMQQLELWRSLAALKGLSYPMEQLEQMWKVVLLHQFHDILPGSSIARVYKEADEAFQALYKQADHLFADAVSAISDGEGYSVWNSLGFARNAVLTLPEEFADGVLVNGVPTPVISDHSGIQATVSLPAFGAASLKPAVVKLNAPQAILNRTSDGYLLENEFLSVQVDECGEITSYCLKEADGRMHEFAAGRMNHFRMFKDIPRRYDAWDIDSNYTVQELSDIQNVTSIEILQASGARVALKITGTLDRSPYEQILSLDALGRRIEFATTINWHEQHRLLKVAFPAAVYAENGFNEVQFGYIARPTHRSRSYDQDRFEVCNHRYSALCDSAHGVAVLNDCKYGISMNGNALELTLLRAATAPDRHADEGIHHFTYAFTAWNGSFYNSDVVKQGYELNVAPVLLPVSCSGFSALSVDQPNIIPETIKMAEDGSGNLIMRLYESKKAQTDAVVTFGLDTLGRKVVSVTKCSMGEEPICEIALEEQRVAVSFKPFEVVTLRIETE